MSPESEPIFDFILALHRSCNGDWKALGQKAGVAEDDITSFLQYAAQFLGNGGESCFRPATRPEHHPRRTNSE